MVERDLNQAVAMALPSGVGEGVGSWAPPPTQKQAHVVIPGPVVASAMEKNTKSAIPDPFTHQKK